MKNENININQRVSIINEALPYIRQFNKKTFVIKYGGASMTNQSLKKKVVEDIALLNYVGVLPIIVHGGGPEIDGMLKKLNIPSRFHDGLRITDEQTIEIVEMVLTGKVQKELVGMLNQAGANAIGLSGKDGNLMTAVKHTAEGMDWGFTGDVSTMNINVVETLISQSFLPVISSVAPDETGQSYNINADTVASVLAGNLKAEKLILLTDTPGILLDKNDKSTLLTKITISEIDDLIKKSIIQGGMIPKVQAAIKALEEGVNSVHILDGTLEHVLLLETFTESGVGTMVVK
ncbi:MAG: acetylglutamate kinase [Candidatus Caenarcaniphilales bacterium]|nr:acetylglutamate kinase [Candidatus Caenarcaniphilales bacterium]